MAYYCTINVIGINFIKYILYSTENFIDKEAFLLLDAETVKELIKPVGPRIKILANLNKLKDDQVHNCTVTY